MTIPDQKTQFFFRVGTPEGGLFAGEMRASSIEEAVSQLRSHGYVPLRLDTAPLRRPFLTRDIAFTGSPALAHSDCEAFCRELALMLRAGLVVSDAVAIQSASLRKGARLQRFCTAIHHGLRIGRRLSDAAQGAGFRLPSDFLPVLQAGEEAGALADALDMLAESYAESAKAQRIYVGALAYPALLLFVAVAVLCLIAFFVAPSLADLFVSMERPVPVPIALLTGFSTLVAGQGVFVASALGLVAAATMLAFGTASGRAGMKALAFRVPVLGAALHWSASRRFAATLRLYLASNVSLSTALPNAIMAAGFPHARRRAAILNQWVRSGEPLTDSLKRARLLPPKLLHMLQIGESSGRLVQVLAAVGAEAKARFEQRMAMTSALLAPLLILAVGGMIGMIVLSVFAALVDINSMAL